MNIIPIKSYNHLSNSYLVSSGYVKSSVKAYSFCGKKNNEHQIKLNESLEYISSFFATPIEITPQISFVYENSEGKQASVNLSDPKLEKAARDFFNCNVSKDKRKEFCTIAKQILQTNPEDKNSVLFPSKAEIALDKKLNEQIEKLHQEGITYNGKHYGAKNVWKYNPYATLRHTLDHNKNVLNKSC